jgi:hypothetical protein
MGDEVLEEEDGEDVDHHSGVKEDSPGVTYESRHIEISST